MLGLWGEGATSTVTGGKGFGKDDSFQTSEVAHVAAGDAEQVLAKPDTQHQ